jgi:hypothetical protein
MSIYLYTLDSHDCFGRFPSVVCAHAWAVKTGRSSYQLLNKPPYPTTVVMQPNDPEMIEAFRNKLAEALTMAELDAADRRKWERRALVDEMLADGRIKA